MSASRTTPPARPSWLEYDLLARATQDGIWAIDADSRTVYADEQLAALLGHAPEALQGRAIGEFMEPPWRSIAAASLRRQRQGAAERCEVVLTHHDGHPIHVAMSMAPSFVDGAYRGTVALVRDVTEQRAAERGSLESAARLQAAIANFPFDFWIADPDGRCVAQNPVSVKLWGDQIGKTIAEGGYSEEICGQLEHDFSRAMAGEVVHYETVFELESLHGNRTLHCERIVAPISVEDEVTGVLGINVDISNRKQLEVALWRSHKLEAVGRLAGGVAHDFNNVLTAIQSAIALIERRVKNDELVGFEAQIINDASRRAADLTRKLLTFAQKQVVAPEKVSPTDLLLGLDRLLRRVIGEDIEVVTAPAESDWPVRIDVSELEHTLVNLAVNSRDAMPQGGTFTIRVENTRIPVQSLVATGTLAPGEYVVFHVSDNGVGIEPSVLAKIFEPFFSTKVDAGGTGLGLASVYGAISQAGGEIDVSSRIGGGTEFRLYLPRAGGDARRSVAATSVGDGRVGTECILLVEDDPLVRSTAARTLAGLGYAIRPCRNATEALSVMGDRGDAVDLVVTDIVMPKMNGPALANELRQLRPALPVLYISGYPDDPRFTEDLSLPGVSFLPKPFTPVQLATAVRSLLDAV